MLIVLSAWPPDRPVWAQPQEIPSGHHQSSWQVHGRHCLRLRKNSQGLHPVYEGAAHWARDLSASGLPRCQECQWEAQVGNRLFGLLVYVSVPFVMLSRFWVFARIDSPLSSSGLKLGMIVKCGSKISAECFSWVWLFWLDTHQVQLCLHQHAVSVRICLSMVVAGQRGKRFVFTWLKSLWHFWVAQMR